MNEKDIAYYGAYAPILEKTKNNVMEQLQGMLANISNDDTHTPAEHILSRIKNADSMQEKLRRKGHHTDADTALRVASDAIGIRVVTHFIGDVYTILDSIEAEKRWNVVKIKDYISSPKPNGYRSLHVILEIPISAPENQLLEALRVEVQLRTIAMDCWAALEHQMKYKQDLPNAELLVDELRRCADEMASTDLSMQTIRDLIRKEKQT